MVKLRKWIGVLCLVLALSITVPPKRSEALILGVAAHSWGAAAAGFVLVLAGGYLGYNIHEGNGWGVLGTFTEGASYGAILFGFVLDNRSDHHFDFSSEQTDIEQIDVEEDLIFLSLIHI